jgi:hypothetical protein
MTGGSAGQGGAGGQQGGSAGQSGSFGKGGSGGMSGSTGKGGSSGSSGTGGAFGGDCEGVPTWATWKATSGMTGDEVVYACTVAQSGCAGKMVGVPYLWSCNQSHVPNCQTQNPQDGTSWTFIGECE